MAEDRGSFGSKIGMILATAGGAVGLGNVWRFPYMTGENGGAAFILVYICCVLLLGIPCMISEFIIGRHGASNTYRAYSRVCGGSGWRWVGLLEVLTGYLIIGYYSVVSGWCLHYIYASIAGQLHGDPAYVTNYFATFSSDLVRPVLSTVLILLAAHYVIIHGIRSGIERASKLMMPVLFILLLIIVVASCLLPGAEKGMEFLFKPDFSKVTPGVFLNALGQSFFSMSIAMGCICTYASYFSRQTNLLTSALQISLIDLGVAILAGLMIFPAAFSVGVNPDSGPSLIFITLPNVFNQAFAGMPVVGWTVSLLFYVLLTLAALTSLISIHEACTSFAYEELHIPRKKGATIITITSLILAVLCSWSFGDVSWLQFAGDTAFNWFDYITGQIFLPVGGLLMCIFLGWFAPQKIVRDQFTNWGSWGVGIYPVFLFLIRYFCPLAILATILHMFEIV